MKHLVLLMCLSKNLLSVKVWRSLINWAALRSPVIALGALALFLMGCNQIFDIKETELAYTNYYPCNCDCSQLVNAVGQNCGVFPLPTQGNRIGTEPNGGVGTIIDGPVVADFNGIPETWWKVHFDDTSLEGWVVQKFLALANDLMNKDAKVCLPAEFNPNLGGSPPQIADLEALCGDVGDEAQARFNERIMGHFWCQCEAIASLPPSSYISSCDDPCPDGEDICLVPGSDPPDPTPEPVSAALFQPTSVCEVTGEMQISVDGHEPKTQPAVQGALQIHGRPCPPGVGCRVGMSYQLTSDDIEFDSGTIFASDPKFVDLSLSGATEPEVINLGPFLGFFLGEVPAGTALSSGHVRRSGSPDPRGLDGRNTEGFVLAMNWANKTCRIAGELLGGTAEGDGDEGTLDATIDVALDGIIVNQPPRPDAGTDQTVECTSPDGADVTLDASGSTDADNNIALYEWRRGSENGPQVTAPSSNPVAQTQQTLGVETYHLLVVDGRIAADGDSVSISVADTTAPQIFCNAPATIFPNDVPEKRTEGISFTATAEDSCTGVSAVVIESFSCTRPKSCRVGIEGATITIFDSGGIGDTISWIVSALDATGNESQKTCELSVIKKK